MSILWYVEYLCSLLLVLFLYLSLLTLSLSLSLSLSLGNIAANKPATASSGQHVAANATDSDCTSFWYSENQKPQWWQVDLQQNYTLGNVVYTWRYPALSGYVQVSLDGKNFVNKIHFQSMGNHYQSFTSFNLNGIEARYVRMMFTEWKYQSAEISDFQIYPFVYPTPPNVLLP
jgi:hypothetical protein